MRGNRGKDTVPEMAVRRVVSKLGYRYRLHTKALRGRPDLVFLGRRKVIFVHGCFWHQHGCGIGGLPGSNLDYWGPKLLRNVQRDTENNSALVESGWQILVLWECEISDEPRIRMHIMSFLG
jgi:DNA mismatch endonuclease, patch repair protein